MQLPRYSKLLFAGALVVGLFAYLVLVDLGVNAGRVHYGVSVDGLEVGGHTFPETVALLKERGRKLKRTPIVFATDDAFCALVPETIGWGPQPYDTAEAAMEVGRPLRSPASIGERVDAWLGGVEVPWADLPSSERIDLFIENCERRTRRVGALDREALRAAVEDSITLWPRRALPLPLVSG